MTYKFIHTSLCSSIHPQKMNKYIPLTWICMFYGCMYVFGPMIFSFSFHFSSDFMHHKLPPPFCVHNTQDTHSSVSNISYIMLQLRYLPWPLLQCYATSFAWHKPTHSTLHTHCVQSQLCFGCLKNGKIKTLSFNTATIVEIHLCIRYEYTTLALVQILCNIW